METIGLIHEKRVARNMTTGKMLVASVSAGFPRGDTHFHNENALEDL